MCGGQRKTWVSSFFPLLDSWDWTQACKTWLQAPVSAEPSRTVWRTFKVWYGAFACPSLQLSFGFSVLFSSACVPSAPPEALGSRFSSLSLLSYRLPNVRGKIILGFWVSLEKANGGFFLSQSRRLRMARRQGLGHMTSIHLSASVGVRFVSPLSTLQVRRRWKTHSLFQEKKERTQGIISNPTLYEQEMKGKP